MTATVGSIQVLLSLVGAGKYAGDMRMSATTTEQGAKRMDAALRNAAGGARSLSIELTGLGKGANSLSALNNSVRIATGAVTGFVGAFTFDKIIRGLAEANKELVTIGETAKRVGLSTDRLQEIRFAGAREGLTGKQVDAGLDGLAKALNDSSREETELSKLFDANNLKLKDRKGQVIGVNEALARVADLTRNAATEFDKIKIAEMAGLTREWVPLLEQGGAAFNKLAGGAQAAGAIIDSETIEKAKQFEKEWSEAVDRWATQFKAAAGPIIGFIDTLIAKAGGLLEGVNRYASGLSAKADLEQNGAAGASRSTIEYAQNEFRKVGQPLPKELQARLSQLDELDRETRRGNAFTRPEPLSVTVRAGRRTSIPVKSSGSDGKSDEEKRSDQVDRYIQSLEKVNRVLEAERDSIGKSAAERAKAIELARIGLVTDEAQKQKIGEITAANVKLREEIEKGKKAERDRNELIRYGGDIAVDAITDLATGAAKFDDVLKRITNSLLQAAIKAALLGEGPLASIFGTSGVGGKPGGILGMLFGGSSGGGGGIGLTPGSGGLYADGGFTGLGPKWQPKGIVHAGEVVWSQDDVRKAGGVAVVEGMRRGIAGYAGGGAVGGLQPSEFSALLDSGSRRQSEAMSSKLSQSLDRLADSSGSGGGMKVTVNNNASNQVEAVPQQNSDGSLTLLIKAIKGDIAQDLVRGQGAISQAFGARQTGRQLRG